MVVGQLDPGLAADRDSRRDSRPGRRRHRGRCARSAPEAAVIAGRSTKNHMLWAGSLSGCIQRLAGRPRGRCRRSPADRPPGPRRGCSGILRSTGTQPRLTRTVPPPANSNGRQDLVADIAVQRAGAEEQLLVVAETAVEAHAAEVHARRVGARRPAARSARRRRAPRGRRSAHPSSAAAAPARRTRPISTISAGTENEGRPQGRPESAACSACGQFLVRRRPCA